MTTKTTTRYWANDNGAVCCEAHAGCYLQSEIEARPRAKSHRTPLGTYELLDSLDVAVLNAEFGEVCETCRWAR